MFSILLVDDERIAVESIRKCVDWKKLGIDRVSCATSGAQARRVFESAPVDLLLCDLEMPQESGIDLLRWVSAHAPDTVSVVLTCHADFSYAKQVVQIGAFDYLLKPAPIEEIDRVLGAAVEKRKELQIRKLYGQYGEQWVRNRDTVEESFWREILLSAAPLRRERLAQQAAGLHLALGPEDPRRPVLLAARDTDTLLSEWNLGDLDYAVKNILRELFRRGDRQPVVVSLDARHKFLLLQADSFPGDALEESCQRFISVFRTHFGGNVCFYCGAAIPVEHLPQSCRALLRMEKDNVSYDNMIFWEKQRPSSAASLPPIPEKDWRGLLTACREEELCGEIRRYLKDLVESRKMNGETLAAFYHDFLQIVYTALGERHIHAGPLIRRSGREDEPLASVEKALASLEGIVHEAAAGIASVQKDDTVIERVRSYIDGHIGEELSRHVIAEAVYLNPNYLSRLFHLKTGRNLMEYVAGRKIAAGERLLARTDLTASEIAHRLGYDNIPYFCKVFKKETGLTPVEYRRKNARPADGPYPADR